MVPKAVKMKITAADICLQFRLKTKAKVVRDRPRERARNKSWKCDISRTERSQKVVDHSMDRKFHGEYYGEGYRGYRGLRLKISFTYSKVILARYAMISRDWKGIKRWLTTRWMKNFMVKDVMRVCCWGLTFRVFTLDSILVKKDAREMASSKPKNNHVLRGCLG